MTAPSSNRFGTFFSRVETEREVLSIVNDLVKGPRLYGLTSSAIDRWDANVTKSNKSDSVGEVVRVLQQIAIRAETHADQSRVVFANEARMSLPVHDLVQDLRSLCKALCLDRE